jgi:hypothetical protein
MFDPMIFSVVEERQKEILEEARRKRLLIAAKAARRRPWGRLFVRAGDVLVAAGSTLQQVFEPADCRDAEGTALCC